MFFNPLATNYVPWTDVRTASITFKFYIHQQRKKERRHMLWNLAEAVEKQTLDWNPKVGHTREIVNEELVKHGRKQSYDGMFWLMFCDIIDLI